MERKIGEIFQYEGKTYQVVESIRCDGCAFNKSIKCSTSSTIRGLLGSCDSIKRKDSINVVFKEINNMENNQLTIDIPEGMEIDLENSNLAKGIVKFKKKYITYDDITDAIKPIITYTSISVYSHYMNRLKAISQLMNIAKYYNKDWNPNWRSLEESKYYIYYSTRNNTYGVANTSSTKYGNIYFRSYKDAQEVIDNPNFRDILDAIYKN